MLPESGDNKERRLEIQTENKIKFLRTRFWQWRELWTYYPSKRLTHGTWKS